MRSNQRALTQRAFKFEFNEREVAMKTYERMKKYIIDHHLNQSSIAREMGMLKSTFNMMVNGKRHVTAEDLEKFCNAVEAPPELFIDYKRNDQC